MKKLIRGIWRYIFDIPIRDKLNALVFTFAPYLCGFLYRNVFSYFVCPFPETTMLPSVKTPGGLRNISSNCYMNAVIQALASSEKIVRLFHNMRELENINTEKWRILTDLIQSINSGESGEEENTELLRRLNQNINWMRIDQQDASELLSSIVSSGCEEDRRTMRRDKVEVPLKIKVIHKQSELGSPLETQDHLGLSVGLYGNYHRPPGVPLKELIDRFFHEVLIDDDPSQTIQMYVCDKIPEILILHIQANKWDSVRKEMVKPSYYITYKEELVLDLEIYETECKEIRKVPNNRYKLTAVVHHIDTIKGGHYVTYRRYRGCWCLANGSQVDKIEFNYDVCPYILVYEKLDHFSNSIMTIF